MNFHITLRLRLVLLVMAAIVPLLVLSVGKQIWQLDDALKRTTEELAFSATLVAANHQQVSEAARHLLESVAVVMAQPGGAADCFAYFKSLKERLPQYANIGIASLDGYTRCDGISRDKAVYIGDRAYFRQAVESRGFSAGGYTLGRISGAPLIQFGLPVTSDSGAITAVAFVGLNLQSLSRQVASIPVPKGGRVLVTDRDGLVLAVNPAKPEMIGTLVENRMLQSRVKSQSSGVEVGPDRGGAALVHAFQPAGQSPASPFFVVVSADRDQAIGPARHASRVELAVLAAVALVGGLLAWLLGGYGIVQPASRILAATQRLQQGERDVRVPRQRHPAGNEFSRIADGFNGMADSLQQRGDALNAELHRSRQARDALQLTLDSMKEGLIAVDTLGRVLQFNRAAAGLLVMEGTPLAQSGDWSRHHGLYIPGTDHLQAPDSLPLVKALGGKSGHTQHIWVRNVQHPAGRLISASFHPMMGEQGPNGETGVVGALMVFADITRLQQMQIGQAKGFIALQETQRRLTQAQQLGRMGNWEFNLSTHELSWSDEVYALYGLTPASFDGKFQSLLDLMHPEDRSRYERLARHARELCTALDTEFRIITPAGQTRWLRQQCVARSDEKGQKTLRVGVVQDITERKLAELTLRDSYSQLSQAQDKLLEAQRIGRFGSWEFDLETQVFSASPQYYEVCGIPNTGAPLERNELLLLVHPGDRPVYVQALLDVETRTPDTHFEAEYRLVTPAGDVRWVHQVMWLVRDAQGQVIRRVGVTQDINDSKLAKLALAANLELLKRTGAMAKMGGWELQLETHRLISSDQVRSIHELELGEAHTLDDAVNAYLPEVRQQIRQAVHAATTAGEPWDLELPLMTKKGRRIWVRTQGRAVTVNGKITQLDGALQDITEQYEARAQLKLLHSSMDRMTDMVMVTAAERKPAQTEREVVYVNQAFVAFSGYSAAEMTGKTATLLTGPLTNRSTMRELGKALKARRTYRSELSCYNQAGVAVCIELDIVPLFDEAQNLTHWLWVLRDLTARKASEQALLDSEQRYMALFAATPLPLLVFDERTLEFLAVNAAAIDQYGFSREEFLAMTVLDIRHERERAWALEQFSKPPPSEALVTMHRKKNGQEFAVQVVSRPILFEGRAGRFTVALDISARVKAEKAVQDQLFTLQRAADAAQAITEHHTLKAVMQEVADQACGVVGAHQALIVLTEGGKWGPSIHSLSLSEKYAKHRISSDPVDDSGVYAMASGIQCPIRLTQSELKAHPRWNGLGNYADKNAVIRGFLAVPLMGGDGQNIGVLQLSDKFEGEFTLQDEYVVIELAHLAATALQNALLFDEIHQLNTGLEQKVVERTEALSRQEALFRALAEEAPQAIWTINPHSEMTYFNGAFHALVGGEKSQWFGKAWLDLIHPEDLPVLLQTWQAALQGHTRYANIRRMRHHSGSWHFMSCTASPVFNASGGVDFWVGIEADITDIKAVETALRLSNQELEAFSYSVSHDLRSPLNTIDGFSRLLAKQLTAESSEKSRHYLSRIQAGVAQMGQLIEDLLSLAQVSRTQLRIEPVDLSALAQKVIDEWRIRDPERNVQVHIAPGLQVEGDVRLLRVAMENLVGNAWKFTSKRERADITVGQVQAPDGSPAYFVRDNGAGFDMAYAQKLFTAFQRLHGAQDFAGTGIGLATVSRVINRHGGRLWADAVVDQGACFYFTLPAPVDSAPPGSLPNMPILV